ncbi:MAG: serine protease [Planctomycetaceae bacterium]
MIHRPSGFPLAGHLARCCLWLGCVSLGCGGSHGVAVAQSVGLPTPRLLTTFPMGGTRGAAVDITITGEHLDGAEELVFSSPQLVAKRRLDPNGQPLANQYTVTIAAECEPGLYEAQVMTRLGLSSSRVFAVGRLPEVAQVAGNTSIASAQELKINSVCNAVVTSRAADHYWFEAQKGQRIVVDCASRGIDSKLEATLVIADETGRDLLVERRTGVIDFTIPETAKYIIKVHELTYQGGPAFYYRLTLRELLADLPVQRHPSTALVSSFSWPPAGLAPQAAVIEVEPNDDRAQPITLPADISGSFARAADTDVFEFEAKKGEEWWIEVASERLGLPTDPAVIVQQLAGTGDSETWTDVAEFQDIASPVKVSSNGYAYDGPPYNAGSADVLGKLVIQQDGRHRISVTDLFGGTRNDPSNVYRLIVRRAEPDFAVVTWPLHMELRNGDRAALSKPLSLRGGTTVALEVVTFRRDGGEGEIELALEGLPDGVTAQGIRIPAGKTRGLMVVTAAEGAPRGFAMASLVARAKRGEETLTRMGRLATVAWPIPDSWGEIPYPRLAAQVPVSVGGVDLAPLTITPATGRVIEARVGEKVTVSFRQVRRSDFSGATAPLRCVGAGFESTPALEVPLAGESSQVMIDLAALKTTPGDYPLAYLGYAVAKYRHQPETIEAAKLLQQKVEQEIAALAEEAKQKAGDAAALDAIANRQKAAMAALTAAMNQVKQATDRAQPQDIVDLLVTEPVILRVQPAEAK